MSMNIYKKCNVATVKPYDFNQFYCNSYNIQNMLITQYNFPKFFYKKENDWSDGDFIDSVYTDRISSENWKRAIKHITLNRNCDCWNQANSEELIAFANELYSDSLKDKDFKITGIRVIRYTNVSSGYPTWRIDVFGKSPNTPNNHKYGIMYDKELMREKREIRFMNGDYYDIREFGDDED